MLMRFHWQEGLDTRLRVLILDAEAGAQAPWDMQVQQSVSNYSTIASFQRRLLQVHLLCRYMVIKLGFYGYFNRFKVQQAFISNK